MKDEIKMGLRSLIYRKKQYISLFMVCFFGIGVSLFALFVIQGMLKSLESKAENYYGGEYQLIGQNPSLIQNDFETKCQQLSKIFPEGTVIAPRYDIDGQSVSYYFEGSSVRQRVVKGVDFKREAELFSRLNYKEGSASDIYKTNGILLSSKIASSLKVHVGDEITFMLRTIDGYINTVSLIVKGIFIDSSLFGTYTSYLDLEYLLAAYNQSSDSFNRLCINIPDRINSAKKEKHYYSELGKIFSMYPFVEDKQIFYDDLYNIQMPSYALIPLRANMDDLKILIDAMRGVTYFVIIMLVIIIVVGVSSTFRVIVMKRINEIGIYKAIGMKRHKIMGMLLSESLILLIVGCLSGFLLSLILCNLVSVFDFSFVPTFDLFLMNGHLAPLTSALHILIICGVVCVTTLLGIMFSVRKSVSITPCQALATTE